MKRKTLTVLLISVALLFGFTAGVSSAPILEKITANLDWSIKFEIDGQPWTPEDGAGNKMAAINYSGTNYLPVRAVSEALGVAIQWDGATRTVSLGEKSDETWITDAALEMKSSNAEVTKDKQYTVQNDKDYGSGVIINKVNSAAKGFELQPNGQYQRLELEAFSLSKNKDASVKVYDANGAVLKEISLNVKDNYYAQISLDIGGEDHILVEAETAPGSDERIFVTGYYR